ncbi:hypothetical protein Sta7437_1087 [Stanieria cyanosphaera PCC 7437]|uniref:Uncharacterized protein n=1 Tax=Stanieria cyanosphaera (strain ATCC 29371 / PCC 7437) TaxID=111780 RepID=K9XQ70_STAC7|nr:hypothetical protein [Stanieria cyanosphaera]AFZ34663.1 hypothetical protein Sta7437_1087 [Stanieria cyanosphaera PCC 7437]
MTYTTQDLIEILDRELKANWKGERIVLSSEERINNPVVAKFLNMDRVSKVFAYQDFRRQVHEYQQEHQVSGIIWHNCTFRGKTIKYPEVYNQLIPIEGDKEILMCAKESILAFWYEVTEGMNFWLANALKKGNHLSVKTDETINSIHQQISSEYANKIVRQAEWAEIDASLTEVYLGLCWGDPLEYRYQWAKPKSGCDRIIAAETEPSSIKI